MKFLKKKIKLLIFLLITGNYNFLNSQDINSKLVDQRKEQKSFGEGFYEKLESDKKIWESGKKKFNEKLESNKIWQSGKKTFNEKLDSDKEIWQSGKKKFNEKLESNKIWQSGKKKFNEKLESDKEIWQSGKKKFNEILQSGLDKLQNLPEEESNKYLEDNNKDTIYKGGITAGIIGTLGIAGYAYNKYINNKKSKIRAKREAGFADRNKRIKQIIR